MARILIADEDEDVQIILRVQFEKMGHEIQVATNIERFINEIIKRPPDVLLLATWFGGVDGATICGLVKQRQPCKDIAIILMPSHAVSEKDHSACGAIFAFVKPFDLSIVTTKVKSILDHPISNYRFN